MTDERREPSAVGETIEFLAQCRARILRERVNNETPRLPRGVSSSRTKETAHDDLDRPASYPVPRAGRIRV
jgi:hypothetical protein